MGLSKFYGVSNTIELCTEECTEESTGKFKITWKFNAFALPAVKASRQKRHILDHPEHDFETIHLFGNSKLVLELSDARRNRTGVMIFFKLETL